jgi:uncharacterized membrane protein YeaQ/YmgE (transglycosylase-associated protein family)
MPERRFSLATSGQSPTTGTAADRQIGGTGIANMQPSNQPNNDGGTMNLIIWLVVGGLIGWVASMIMKTDAQQGLMLNVIVGIVGALLGGWLLSPLVGAGTVNQGDFSLMGLLVSLGGAIILLFVVNLIRRGTAGPRV